MQQKISTKIIFLLSLTAILFVGIATSQAEGTDGVCGTANGQSLPGAPTTNLCASGSASQVTGSGTWNWTCVGSDPACATGDTKVCTTTDSCAGKQTCTAGAWGACVKDVSTCGNNDYCSKGQSCNNAGVCVNKCSKCTCPTDKPTCNADESCASATPSKCDPATQVQLVDGTCASQCSDGTQVNQCSNSSRGFQCAGVPSNAPTHLELIVACPTCECPGYKSCQGDHTCVNDTGLPESFSWANKDGVNWLSPSKSQGGCGSCWDFAAVAAVEAMYNIEHGAGSSPDLSEQAVLSCSKAGTCNGGDPTSALVYIAKGIVTESCSPYSGIDTTACVDQCGTKHGFSSLRSPSGNLFRFVYENGPVPILTDDGNHAVLMIGWTKEGYINIKDSASCSLGVTGDLSGVYVQPQGTY